MVQFADVLSQLGSEPEPDGPTRTVRVNTAGWDSWLKDEASPAPTPGSFYIDPEAEDAIDEADFAPHAHGPDARMREEILQSDYRGPAGNAEARQPEAEAPRVEPLDLARELSKHRLETMSETQLRALRRRLARRVHPDLQDADAPDPQAMARVNVAIDTALRQRRAPLRQA